MATKQSLFPRYTRVDDFGPDEDYEDGEETSYVTLDLGGTEPTLVPNSSSYRLIGLDTPTPYLQLSGTILKGIHDNLLGTELLFANSECESPSNSTISHLANTSQRISFRAVQLRKKDATPAPTKRKGKGRGEGVIDLTDNRVVERMTGKLPKERRKRGPKKKGDDANEDEVAEAEGGDGDGAEPSASQPKRRAPARRASTRTSKGKGKARAEESDSDDDDEWVGDD
ncbi:uncharacterized protein SCHCODRAFT_02521476 [Schizophyllum commune H4-8]|uniref:Transcription factor TFIIIC triple barrel domain-containing protein n=1 Tax=Schizophyllum commune (strain H4-8 / FGSC 9210) TaxID=578458 RepID=D8QKI0_SCHCM|nr:uncharacterized protein SCHCODRAFT_02521476 [Schizophyllum commune H4-8]KAI5885119.1 hypothetical protein SCHCODRAFT_02521476 [Schizophyllum commune H4-8]